MWHSGSGVISRTICQYGTYKRVDRKRAQFVHMGNADKKIHLQCVCVCLCIVKGTV